MGSRMVDLIFDAEKVLAAPLGEMASAVCAEVGGVFLKIC